MKALLETMASGELDYLLFAELYRGIRAYNISCYKMHAMILQM